MVQIIPNCVRVCRDFIEIPADHEFNELQRAIDSNLSHDDYILKLCGNFDDNHGLEIIRDKKIIIDGQGVYGISFTAGQVIATPDKDCSLIFRNMKYLTGDAISIRNDCNIGFYNCNNVTTSILNIDGKYTTINIENTNIIGTIDYSVIEINHSGSIININKSFMKGGNRCPAIHFNSESENKIKIKNTTLLHNSEDMCAIQKDHHYEDVSLSIYNCYGSYRLCDVGINVIINDKFIDNHIDY